MNSDKNKFPKVLLLTTELDFGGVEIGNLKRAFALREFGYEPEFACLHKLGKVGQELQANGFKVHSLESSPKIPNPKTLWRLIALLKEVRPDIVHASCIEASFYGLVASRMVGRKVKVIAEEVGMLIDGHGDFIRGWKARRVGRFVWNNADLSLGVAECVRQTMIDTEAAPPDNTLVVPYSIDRAYLRDSTNGKQRANPDETVIGCVARLSPEKGQRMLLKAFAQALVARPDLRLWLVGDGPDRVYLEKSTKELGITSRVEFLGTRRDIPELLRQMDMFVLASQWEGLPNAILEAMASGVPIVASSVGGVPEVIVDGESGFLVPVGDVDAFAEAIVRLAEMSPADRERIVAAAEKTALSLFSPEVVTEKLSGLYRDLASGRRRGA